jgi:hypothetical protein
MVEYSAFNRFVPGSNPGQSMENTALSSQTLKINAIDNGLTIDI